MENVGDLIRAARAAAGLTQAQLAERAGTSQAAIARYERNTVSPAVATLERILRAAGTKLQLSSASAVPANLSGDRAVCLRRHRKEVLRLASQIGAHNVRLFGSVVRGDATDDSDIDLLVDYDSSEGLLPILHLGDQLSALLGYKVDVAPIDMLRNDVAASARVRRSTRSCGLRPTSSLVELQTQIS